MEPFGKPSHNDKPDWSRLFTQSVIFCNRLQISTCRNFIPIENGETKDATSSYENSELLKCTECHFCKRFFVDKLQFNLHLAKEHKKKVPCLRNVTEQNDIEVAKEVPEVEDNIIKKRKRDRPSRSICKRNKIAPTDEVREVIEDNIINVRQEGAPSCSFEVQKETPEAIDDSITNVREEVPKEAPEVIQDNIPNVREENEPSCSFEVPEVPFECNIESNRKKDKPSCRVRKKNKLQLAREGPDVIEDTIVFIKQEPVDDFATFMPIEPQGNIANGANVNSTKRVRQKGGSKQRVQCDICKKSICTYGDLQKHKRTVHAKILRYTCKVCSRPFASAANCRKHEVTHSTDRPLFQCEKCDKSVKSKASLKQHMETVHQGVKEWKCDICGKQFTSQWGLSTHIRAHINLRPFTCNVCGHQSVTNSDLRKHLVKHTGAKPYACKLCSKRYSYRNGLTLHMAQHTGNLPTCDLCFKKFKSGKEAVKKHKLKYHSGKLPFQCLVCKEWFAKFGDYKAHYDGHMASKPFQCDFCKRGFNNRGDLLKHVYIHLNRHRLKCSLCDLTFTRRQYRAAHVEKSHGDLNLNVSLSRRPADFHCSDLKFDHSPIKVDPTDVEEKLNLIKVEPL